MPRYKQVTNLDGTHELVEITNDVRSRGSVDVFVSPDVDFISPVDGTRVSGAAQLREHNKRHNVVHESEYGTAKERESFYARKAAERADFFQSTENTAYGRKLARERKQAIIDAVNKHGHR